MPEEIASIMDLTGKKIKIEQLYDFNY